MKTYIKDKEMKKWDIEVDVPLYDAIKHYADTRHEGSVEDAVLLIMREHLVKEEFAMHKEDCGCVFRTNEGLAMLDYDADLPLGSSA
jgi:hypothetical protein